MKTGDLVRPFWSTWLWSVSIDVESRAGHGEEKRRVSSDEVLIFLAEDAVFSLVIAHDDIGWVLTEHLAQAW